MDILRLTLRQLQIFAAVARTGSTTAASRQIALSQSATSSALNELERLLELRLFDRAGKRLLLNDSGRALLPGALALLNGAAGIEQMATRSEAQAHALRIGASTTLGNYVLPKLLSRFFAAQYVNQAPTWQATIMIANTAAICRAVAAFELDAGLIEGPSHEPSLDVHRWLKDDLLIVAAPDSALGRAGRAPGGPKVPIKSLREAVWLLREPGSGTREATDQLLLPHLRAYRRSIELGSSEAIKRAAAEGLGIACLSKWVVDELLQSGRLCVLPTSLPPMVRPCHLIVHTAKHFTPALRSFVEQLRVA